MSIEQSNLLILYSGGADSRLMLQFALDLGRVPHCVLFDYRQKHVEELDYAAEQLETLNVSYSVVQISGSYINSGLTGNKIEAQYENVHEMNVPARNTIFLSIAAGMAESNSIREIWFGADYSDRENLFPDCYQEYVYQINEFFKYALTTNVTVRAPLLGFTKEMVLDYLEMTTGVTRKELYSGYERPEGSEESIGC